MHAVPAGFEYVAIHDGARPLITTEAIDHAIDVLVSDRALDGVVCGQPAIDTLKIVDGDNIVETPPRELYWVAQTPQIFSVDAMKRAHAAAIAEGFIGTDDSSLVERMGGRVRCVQSPRDNLKVTVPEDLRPVTAILSAAWPRERIFPMFSNLRIGHGYDATVWWRVVDVSSAGSTFPTSAVCWAIRMPMCSRTRWPTLFWAPAAGETSANCSPTPILPMRRRLDGAACPCDGLCA